MAESLRFGVLGPVTVVRAGADLPVTAAMPRAILVALLFGANKPVPVRRLESALWRGGAPLRAGASLHNHVHRLRRHLGGFGSDRIRTVTSGYRLEIRTGELDVHEFTELYERGRRARLAKDWTETAEALSAMLALWRGEPAADVDYPVLDDTERERLREMRMQALDWRAQADLRLGRHAEVLADLRVAVAEHPLAEIFPAHLMLALHRCGRDSEALDVFQSTRASLRMELGVGPGPVLADLNRRILQRDPRLDRIPAPAARPVAVAVGGDAGAAAGSKPAARAAVPRPRSAEAVPTTPRTLPAAIPYFSAREAEVGLLIRVLTRSAQAAADTVPVAVIGGMAGIGKSALAIHAARLVQDRFPDGQLFADLRGSTLRPAPPHSVLAMFLRQLGVAVDALPAGVEERSALLRSLLADRKVLLVLDDARDDHQLALLLPGGSDCAVLVTSRTRPTAMPGCLHLDLDTLSEDASHQVLERLADSDRLAGEPSATTAVLDVCAGLPLALRIAAGRLAARPSWRVADLADRIQSAAARGRRLDVFALGDVNLRPGLAAMYAALAGTDATDDTCQRALCLLGVWTEAEFGVTEAAALLAVPVADAEHILEALVDAYLLRSPRPGSYELHPLVRDFAVECAQDVVPRPAGQPV